MDTQQRFEPGEPRCSGGTRGSGGLSTALTKGINRHNQAASRSGTPGSPSWRKQPGIPAPPHDLLLWNNSTEGLENGTSCERRPALDVCPPVASEFAAGITLGSPFPTGGLFFT